MINWKMVSFGAVLMAFGNAFQRATKVPWTASFFSSILTFTVVLVVVAPFVVAFGFFWGRWFWGLAFGALLAVVTSALFFLF